MTNSWYFKTNVILKCYWNINKSQQVLVQASQVALVVKSLLSKAGDIRNREDPLEEGMAIHSTIFAWKIQWILEPGGLQSIELQRVRRDRSNLTHKY